MAEAKKRARIERFTLRVCGITGDPGCLGWPDHHEGPCEYGKATFHRCSECDRDDVYGDLDHDESCSLYVSPSAVEDLS